MSTRNWILIAMTVMVIDQLTKQMAQHYLVYGDPLGVVPGFNLTLMHNTGAAFSFLSDASGWQRWFFTGIAALVSCGIVFWLARIKGRELWLATALSLILGGAVGNLWDRVMLGYVVDFIQVYYAHWSWPAFNIADSAITVGAIMLLLHGTVIGRARIDVA